MPVDIETQTTHLPPLKAPRGTELTCKGWQQEAAMRMLMNNLDEEVASVRRTWSSTAAPGGGAQLGMRSTRSCAR
jgi:hypothetical protein